MRRDDEKKEKRNRLLIGVFIVAIMVLSTFGFVLNYSEGGKTERVKGIKFVQLQYGVQAKIDDRNVVFNFFPSQSQQAPVAGKLALKDVGVISITANLDDDYIEDADAISLFLSDLLEKRGKQIILGYTGNGTSRPVITCDDAVPGAPVILLQSGNSTIIQVDGDCIIATAQGRADLYLEGERLALVALGVLDG